MRWLSELEEWTQEVADRLGPAVVAIGSRGSGVVVGQGQVLTNAHHARASEVAVRFAQGREATGSVAGVDLDGDIAVVAVDTGDVEAPAWSPDAVAIGRAVLALARDWSGGLRVTLGMVSAIDQRFRGPGGRRISGGIEHTAPLARGSSGGPVVDSQGRLLGLNTNRLADGFYLALTADEELRSRVEALAAGQVPERPRLGIGVAPGPVARRLRASVGLPPRDGVLVRAVGEGSPAERAGLRPGDLIVTAAADPVASVDELHEALERLGDGTALPLGIVRGTDEQSLSVTFETREAEGG